MTTEPLGGCPYYCVDDWHVDAVHTIAPATAGDVTEKEILSAGTEALSSVELKMIW